MRFLFALLALLCAAPSFSATTDYGTLPASKCVENPCTPGRFPPYATGTYAVQSWTKSSAISSVTTQCNPGTNAASDPDINPVYDFHSTCPAGLTCNTSTGTVSGTPSAEGSGRITVECKNDLGTLTQYITYNIDESPSTPGNTYYVDCANGNDGNTGLSNAQRWKTVGKVNSTVTASGADVFFLQGTTCTDAALIIDWGGTAADKAIVGTYYMNGGSETVGYTTTRATIKGTYTSSCSVSLGGSGLCPIDQSGAIPSTRYAALVEPRSSHVTIQDLNVIDSSGYGIADTVGPFVGVTIQRNVVSNPAGAGIINTVGADWLVTGNSINKAGIGGNRGDNRWNDRPFSMGASKLANATPARTLWIGNTITNSYGEGIGAYRRDDNVFRGNTIDGAENLGVYIEGAENIIVEQNTIFAHDTTTPTSRIGAIGVGLEYKGTPNISSALNIVIRNNRIANASSCFQIQAQPNSVSGGAKISGIEWIGNTCLAYTDNAIENISSSTASTFLSPAPAIAVRNSIFAKANGPTAATQCQNITSQWSMDYNNWEVASADADCVGSHDTVVSSGITGSIDWTLAGISVTPSDANWKPSGGASNQGLSVLTDISALVNLQYAGYIDGTAVSVPCANVTTTLLGRDWDCTVRGTPPDPGAEEQ